MPLARPANDVLGIERLAAAGIEGANAGIEVGAQRAQLLDMREQLLPDLLLRGLGEIGHFGQGLASHGQSRPRPRAPVEPAVSLAHQRRVVKE